MVFVHREACPIGPALFEWLFWMRRASIVFDFDDAIFLRNVSSANAWLERLKCPGKIESILSWSHHVIAGNGYLAEFARRYNRNVSVLSTPVDTDRYVPRHGKRPSSKEVIVGWIGTPTTAGYLNLLSEVLPPLLKRHQNIRFRVIGANPADWRVPQVPDRIEHRDWSLQTELQELQEFDLGLMPMPDTDWARGKCGHKALLYMSVGIPVVASPVGVASEILEGHQGGFLASSAEEWQENLSQLIEDVSFRKQMGLAGRARVEARYSLRNNAPKLVSLLEEAYVQRHDNG
jgi:glycosyltransferase involved in cell wall biosynthesis